MAVRVSVPIDGKQIKAWFQPDSDDPTSGAIAPDHHCDEKGEITLDGVMGIMSGDDSLAHVYGGKVQRYGSVIAELKDIVESRKDEAK